VYYLGTLILSITDKSPETIFTAIYISYMTSTAAGMNAANIPSMTRAKQAAQKVFALIDEKSTLDVREAGKAKIQDLSKV